MSFKYNLLVPVAAFCLLLGSCKKYLEEKSDASLATPATMDDLEAILRNATLKSALILTNGGTDEYFYEYSVWLARPDLQKNGYVWGARTNDYDDWRSQYINAYYANTVLSSLDVIPANGNQARWNNIRGEALFIRAHAFYQVAQLYAPQYDPATAGTDPGIPLRLDADLNVPSVRSSVQQTYDRIIQDLTEAASLMDDAVPNTTENKGRPTKAAAYALLARAYLQKADYAKAKESADASLQQYNTLMDFNNTAEVTPASATLPVVSFNSEMLYFTNTNGAPNSSSSARVDSNLYRSFAADDLRKTAYFSANSNGTYRFKGTYNGALSGGLNNLFNGLANDEVYLTRSECQARLGNTAAAMQDLNALLVKRWKAGLFTPLTASSSAEALSIVLRERWKELIYRGTRWSDLKRLNKDPQYAVTIKRDLNGTVYTLPPNDLRYALLIPVEVINVSNLQQNSR